MSGLFQLQLEPLLAILGSPIELAIVGMIVLLLFGTRLPGVARSLGQSLTEFKKGMSGIEDDRESEGAPKNGRRIEEERESDVAQKVK